MTSQFKWYIELEDEENRLIRATQSWSLKNWPCEFVSQLVHLWSSSIIKMPCFVLFIVDISSTIFKLE